MSRMPLIAAAATALLLWTVTAAQDAAGPEPTAAPNAAGRDPNAASDPNVASPRRKPFQDEILKALLQEQELPRVIRQQDPDRGVTTVKIGPMRQGEAALLEGTMIVERPAQFGYANDKPQLTIRVMDLNRSVTLHVLPSRLLEALEREFEDGTVEFVISGEITRYKEMTYILVRKAVTRVNNGNVSP